jgi:hypothetical protein
MASALEKFMRLLKPTHTDITQPQSPILRLPRRSDEPANDYPDTYWVEPEGDPEAPQVEVFEPALRQYARAFRLSDPVYEDEETRQTWREARDLVTDHLLRTCASSDWKPHLILRGSTLLKAWLPASAREPRDIDWLVIPEDMKMSGPEAAEMLEGIVQRALDRPIGNQVVFHEGHIAAAEIWTYERVPGTRLAFPWYTPNLFGGVVQMDFVFGEVLPVDPVLTPVSIQGEESVELWTATKELSLAWKLLWLETDTYPQGKDLYDAVLLAEQTSLSKSLLEEVLRSGDYPPQRQLEPDFPMEWDVDWDNFRLEYPSIAGDAAYWQERLTRAVAPMFSKG